MPDSTFDAVKHVEHMAAVLGLAVDPVYMPGIVGNMARTAEIARLVTDFPLSDDTEIAPTFHPAQVHPAMPHSGSEGA
ncbi:hypothetical protein GGE65_005532 [Skermanella aerolata]|uniref:DUF4089 domain-containing protein n=1 Tax=Skermanella aerolata TaxID=393310 RepID=A0A512DY78_9PROT|nr:DUF4089 domain-containing protein [Skermanella aerolata]KJB93934.1 hypothetical protein N826_13740 [Skermanella aerolata KACC 11604]GEO41396.1 hypothetical protein SAE02_55440 [Skermanella aerolata]